MMRISSTGSSVGPYSVNVWATKTTVSPPIWPTVCQRCSQPSMRYCTERCSGSRNTLAATSALRPLRRAACHRSSLSIRSTTTGSPASGRCRVAPCLDSPFAKREHPSFSAVKAQAALSLESSARLSLKNRTPHTRSSADCFGACLLSDVDIFR